MLLLYHYPYLSPHLLQNMASSKQKHSQIQSRMSTGEVMYVGEQQGTNFPHKWSYGRNGTDRSAEILPEEGSCLSITINFHFTAKANQIHLVLPKYPVI